MVDQWMKSMNRKTPALQPANGYDPWAAWKQDNDPYALQTQGTMYNPPTGASPYTQSGWGEWTSAGSNPFGVRYAQQGPPPSTPSGIDPTYAAGNYPQQTTYSYPTAPGVGVGALAGTVTGQAKTGLPGSDPSAGIDGKPVYDTTGGGTSVYARGADGAFHMSGVGNPWSLPPAQRYYYYNGHNQSDNGALGDTIALPVAYNEAADTKRWEFNGQNTETTMRRAVRYAYDMVRDGRAKDFQHALSYTMANFAALAGGQGVGYDANAFDLTQATQAYNPGAVYLKGGAAAGGGAGAGAAGGGAGAGAGTGQGSGSGAGAGATGGGGGIFPSEVEMELARQSPEYAIAAYRKARGVGRDKSAVGEFREGMMGQAVRAYLTMLGAGAPGGNPVGMANQGLGDIASAATSGTGVGGILRQQAQQMMGQDLSGFTDKQLVAMMGAAQGAGGFGLGPFAQYALENSYNEMADLATDHGLSGATTAVLANPAARKKFMDDLARYLAVR